MAPNQADFAPCGEFSRVRRYYWLSQLMGLEARGGSTSSRTQGRSPPQRRIPPQVKPPWPTCCPLGN